MLYEILPDPRLLKPSDDAEEQTLQIHRPLPDRVPIGHFDPENAREIVDETVGRGDYIDMLQQACVRLGEGLRIRFFDHFETGFDASILDALTEIRSLSIDGMKEVRNADAIGRLPKLHDLLFGPWGKQEPNVLARMRVDRLERFTLAGTQAPKIDLAPLAGARSMRTLRLLGRGRNTEAIGGCAALTELAIDPSESFSLAFVTRLERLEVLKLVLGKKVSIAEIGAMPALRDLSTFEVRLLEDLGDLQRFPSLRRLQLSDQPRIAALRTGRGNSALQHMRLYSMPSLERIEGLSALPALQSLWAYNSVLDPDWDDLPASLTHFQLVAKKMKGRDAHDAEVRAHGLIPEVHPDSHFFYK